MGIFGRYVLFEILKTFLPLWLGLSFFPLLAEWLGSVFKLQGSFMLSVLAFAYKTPSYLQLVFPVALVVATVIVFRGMNRNREIVAFESFGVRYRDLILPLFATVFITGIPFLLISMELAPKGLKEHQILIDKIKGKVSSVGQMRQEKIWYKSGDVLYNVGFYNAQKQELLDVALYEFDANFQLSKITNAKRAIWNGKNWLLLEGTEVFVSNELEQSNLQHFDSLDNHLMEAPVDLVRFDFNPEVLTQGELMQTMKRYKQMGINTSLWESTFHSRLSYLALSFILLLLALPRTLKFRRGNNLAKDLTFITIGSLFLWILYSYCINLAAEGFVNPALAAWGPVILLLMYGLFEITRLRLKGQSE
ncbi:MAG: LptF/LptG family permease [Bdellovibrionota bacterium]